MTETKELQVKPEGAVSTVLTPSAELKERFSEVADNLSTMEDARLPRMKLRPEGLELSEDEAPVKEITGTIVHVRRVNQYYEKSYDPANIQPPDCYSLDGVKPEKESPQIQNPTCSGCPKAEWGSSAGGQRKGKACRNMKPIYILVGDESIMPRQLTVPPTSLKAINNFLLNISERGVAYRKAKVKIETYKESPKDTYAKIRFSFIEKLGDQRAQDVEFLRNNWLPIMDKQMLDRSELAEDETAPITEEAPATTEKKPKARPSADAKGQF